MSVAVEHRLQRIFTDVFALPAEHIRPETSPEMIESWDSVNHLNLVLAMEQEFDVQFTPEEIEQLLSVDAIVKLLEEKLQATGSL